VTLSYLFLWQDVLGHTIEEPGAALLPHFPGLGTDPAEKLPLRSLNDLLNKRAFLSEFDDAQRAAPPGRIVLVASLRWVRFCRLDTAFLADILATILAKICTRPQHHTEFLTAERARANTGSIGTPSSATAFVLRSS